MTQPKVQPVKRESFKKCKDLADSVDLAQQQCFSVSTDPKINKLIDLQEDLLKLGLHRLVQRAENSKHKFPVRLRKSQRAAVEAYGDCLYQEYLFCQNLHSEWGGAYKNSANWFLQIILEFRVERQKDIINLDCFAKGKTAEIAFLQNYLNQLREGFNNPISRKRCPHKWQLIQAALAKRGSSDQFRRTFWNPYLTALVAWKNQLKSNEALHSVFYEDGVFFKQIGPGNFNPPMFG